MTRRSLFIALVLSSACSGGESTHSEPDGLSDATTSDTPAEDAAADAAADSASDAQPDVAPSDAADDARADIASDAPEPPDPLEWALGSPGGFRVGYRPYEVTYARPDGEGERTISVSVWYPTLDEDGDAATYLGLFRDEASFLGAAPAAPAYEGGYPVHVHSHGFQGWSATSAFMMRHYASHGWIAVAPDHIGNTFLDHRDPLDNAHYFLKPLDIRESLDLLAELPSDDPLAGLARLDDVLMSGHSFGTYACWAIAGATYDEAVVRSECEDLSSGPCTEAELGVFLSGELDDERVVAIMPLAGTYRPAWFGDEGYESVDVPILAMTGSEDNPRSALEQWDRLSAETDMTWVELEGACHQTFALGGCDNLSNEDGYEIVNTFALAFGRHHVLGDESEPTTGVLSGEIEVSDAVTVRRGE